MARFFWTPKPCQSGSSMTRAPAARAISQLRSRLPPSTTTISSANETLARHSARLRSSFSVMIATLRRLFMFARWVGRAASYAPAYSSLLYNCCLQAVPTALAGLAWRVLASHIQLSDDRLHAPVNAQVDAVFVLSVRSFHDRIAHIEAELQRHGIAFEWIFEHDAAELTPDLIEATFAPSDMGPPQQSLVLKHIETWKRCVARGYRRILVFEDDAMLASDFTQVFGAAMQAADVIEQPYMIYLGCGDNKYVSPSQSSGSVLVKTNLALPATDAIVVDQRAARLRLEYAGRQKITRPADWLMREADAAMGIAQYWLAEPIVEQGSMTGRFASVLDRKRLGRSRAWIALRFRWDRWRRRTLKRDRSDEASMMVVDSGPAGSGSTGTCDRASPPRWLRLVLLRVLRSPTSLQVVMLLAFITAPSCCAAYAVGLAPAAGQGAHRVSGLSCCCL